MCLENHELDCGKPECKQTDPVEDRGKPREETQGRR